MTVGETIKLDNIQYPTWRELFISYLVNDMVINSISPNFPIGSNWSYVEDAEEEMFDNYIIKERYKQNKNIIEMIDSLKTLYKDSEDIENIEESRSKIQNTICQLNLNKLLSNISIVIVDEFADQTIGTTIRTINNAKITPPHCKKFVTDVEFFDKIMFDLMYGCHVLHKRVGVIHFDLHLNNMTIANLDPSFYKRIVMNINIIKIRSIMYVIF